MFFLSISAHLFIYLWIPLFVVICFYFRGTRGNPEGITLLPEAIVCEYPVPFSHEEKNYIYEEEEFHPEKIPVVFPEVRKSQNFFFFPAFYAFIVCNALTLRAPPVSSCI
ncbi:hypothetical protein [Odoribacter sp. Z80]|uniref:hypothetical protein n=1 Tax=Odoribacter sp. Z80 TaxID=2304575 RepID=UPI00137B28E2|nr:hypothetical protein [Odoribacter sp. Z80]NCE71511.1 hypothetical protein [Odoribacter sp. Z80]